MFSDTYQERVLSVLPFFHIYGFNGILNGVLAHGLHMITIPKFTPELYIECVLKYKVSCLLCLKQLTSLVVLKINFLQLIYHKNIFILANFLVCGTFVVVVPSLASFRKTRTLELD